MWRIARGAVSWPAFITIGLDIGLGLAGVAGASEESSRPKEALAVVVRSEGEAWVKNRESRRLSVRDLQLVGDGATVEIGEKARVTLVCRDGGLLELEATSVVTAERCHKARQRAAGRFESLAPDGGRLNVFAGSWVLEGETRDDQRDYGRRPILLFPRCPLDEAHRLGCSRLSKLPSSIRWVSVPSADRYRLHLSGFDEVQLDAGAVTCEEESEVVPGRICSLSWPEAWLPRPGTHVFLQVEARLGLFDFSFSEKSEIEILGSDQGAEIDNELAEIVLAELDPKIKSLLAATTLAEHDLLNEALAALEPGVDSDVMLQVALGDLYRRVDLRYPAFFLYTKALHRLDEGPDQPALRAAANFGLGWIHYLWGSYEPARAHAQTAATLCRQLGLPETEQATRLLHKIPAGRNPRHEP